MPPITRQLTPDDAPQYTALRAMMLEESPHSFGSSPGEARCTHASELELYLAKPSNIIVGTFEDDQLASVAGLMRESKSKQQHRAFIWGVYTPPTHRSKGYALSAMQLAIDLARSWPGVEVINLSVLDLSIAARELYKAMGFEQWGTEPDSIRYQGQPIPSHHLILNLTD
jgi:RimJ/RimL family protein N-acetyltransferase